MHSIFAARGHSSIAFLCVLCVLCGELWLDVAAAQDAGTLQNPALDEISGLARSLADPEILWGHNDSFSKAVLFRIGLDGADLGSVQLEGGALRDWEDIASFRWQGRPALLLADVGDNFGAFDHVTLYAVGDPGRGHAAELLWTLAFRYPDGARDCEAVAVHGDDILLLSKRDRPPRLYRLALPQQPPARGDAEPSRSPAFARGTASGVHTAQLLGEVRSLPAPGAAENRRAGWLRRSYLDMPTALTIAPDGRRAAIVTPRAAHFYRREPRQSWLEAFNRPPQTVPLPDLPQIEAGAFSADGRHLYIASEGEPPGFARIAVPP